MVAVHWQLSACSTSTTASDCLVDTSIRSNSFCLFTKKLRLSHGEFEKATVRRVTIEMNEIWELKFTISSSQLFHGEISLDGRFHHTKRLSRDTTAYLDKRNPLTWVQSSAVVVQTQTHAHTHRHTHTHTRARAHNKNNNINNNNDNKRHAIDLAKER